MVQLRMRNLITIHSDVDLQVHLDHIHIVSPDPKRSQRRDIDPIQERANLPNTG